MEEQRESDQVDFWIIQYQRLLDSKPEILLQKVHLIPSRLLCILPDLVKKAQRLFQVQVYSN